MRMGLFGGDTALGPVDAIVDKAKGARAGGFASFWMPHIVGIDALTALAVVGREVPDIELGTAVVAIYTHHPTAMAQQALTVNEIADGRLALGIGLSHRVVIEGMLRMSFEKPVRHLREYLSILMALVHEGAVEFDGEVFSAHYTVNVRDRRPCPVLVAALGSQMLGVTGAMADGTITWMVGVQTLQSHIVPTITAAAERADRPAPRVVAALPVYVTDDPGAARERAAKTFAMYNGLPSYRAMLDREGADGPADVAIIGGEDEVREQLEGFADAGATDFVAVVFAKRGSDEEARTRSLLTSIGTE